MCDNALDGSLWLEYLNYASNELQIGPVVLELSERALRNCPWDGTIWIQSLHELEKFTCDTDKMRGKVFSRDYLQMFHISFNVIYFTETFERGLVYSTTGDQAGNLWLKYIQFLRRKIDFQNVIEADVQLFMKTLTAAEEHLNQRELNCS